MVLAQWGGLVARAAVLLSSQSVERSNHPSYASNTHDAVQTLQSWYDAPTGLWTTTGWWNSANCLTTLADWALLDSSGATSLNIANVIANTFTNAQLTPNKTEEQASTRSVTTSTYDSSTIRGRGVLMSRGSLGFLNEFYDDEGWWALGWIRSWDLTRDSEYLDMAESIFEDMRNGTDNTCGGGIWWSKKQTYKNAIANELYLSVAASLANRVPARKAYYLDIAQREWTWFKNSGMINAKHLVNDGLKINPDGTCVNNGYNTWSYNQGVILGGLVELSKATGNSSYLDDATAIAKAAIAMLSDGHGVIHESGGCEPNCGGDGSQFKGIFVRNLHYLHSVAPQDAFKTAILTNADSIWATDRDEQGRLGISWTGPVEAGGGPNSSTHSSALAVLVAAMAVLS